jgi:hypothetical protein
MDPGSQMSGPRFSNPLPEALGNPFVLRHRSRFYLYGTNDGPPPADGRQVPVFRSDDLVHWEPLGGALVPSDAAAAHRAPKVLAWNGRFYMVVSFGDFERTGHALWVAVADRPEGPFGLHTRVSGAAERSSIDGSWLLDDDGRLYLYRCLDFIADDDPPHGTGIVVQEMRDPFTPLGAPATVLRAHAPWHVSEKEQTMPLYGGRTFAEWTTIEGPAPVCRRGKYYCGYSGGNFAGGCGTGEAVADAPLGPYRDPRGRAGPIFGTMAGVVEGPGHVSVVRPDMVHDWIVLHGRSPGAPARRVWLCPASWDEGGLAVGPLTDRPQAAPPLSDHLWRFDGPDGQAPEGWLCKSKAARWRTDGEALRQEQEASLSSDPDMPNALAFAWREPERLSGDWVLELYLRFPDGPTCDAGVVLQGPDQPTWVLLRPSVQELWARPSVRVPLPRLGSEPFRPAAFHALEVRAEGRRARVRLDGVVVLPDLALPRGRLQLGLIATGVAAFDAVAITYTGNRIESTNAS